MSDKKDDFLSFDAAVRELGMQASELQKLVSDGSIRAHRPSHGQTQFRAEDVAALKAQREGDTKLSLSDSLEDDTGMVTEQLSEEDTLLAEEDVEEVAKPKRAAVKPARTAVAQPAMATAAKEPVWVTAVAALSFLVVLWGMMVCYNASQEANPASSMFTSAWAQK
ncbi:MAG: hypothetical protein ACK501_00730 [Planctomycetota bacterium]